MKTSAKTLAKTKVMRVTKPKTHHELQLGFPIFSNYQVVIVFTENIPASVAYLSDRDYFNTPYVGASTAACHLLPEDRGIGYVLFPLRIHAGAIAHECWHAIYGLMNFAGVKFEDEFIAYHLGYLVQQVVEHQAKLVRRENAHSRRSGQKTGTGRIGRHRRNSA